MGMTDQELERLEALEKGASEAPWTCTGNTFYVREVSREKPGKENFEYFVMPGNSGTAAFIAAMRNSFPALVARLRAAEKLEKYAGHYANCTVPHGQCSCGYSTALEGWRRTRGIE
jgi:hypothetical protein